MPCVKLMSEPTYPLAEVVQERMLLWAGSNLVASEEEAMEAAAATGYPVLLKATGGGGGIGIYICHTPEEVSANFAASVRHVPLSTYASNAWISGCCTEPCTATHLSCNREHGLQAGKGQFW